MKIVHFGTFDVQNYGDVLFPLILQMRLADAGHEFIHTSPRGGPPVWRDCVATVPIESVLEDASGIDAVLVGGGNTVHAAPTTLPDYSFSALSGLIAYPSIWLGAGYLAARLNVPLCWNAPSVAQPFSQQTSALARWSAGVTDYLAVRDITSKVWLREAGVTQPIHVVPDTALEVSRLWPKETLANVYAALFEQRKRAVPERTISFHFNRRFVHDVSTVAALLDRMCREQSATPILLAAGPCHGDGDLQREIARLMTMTPLVIDQPQTPREIAACTAYSIAYVGSSLHGMVSACAYGTPGMMVMPRTNAPVSRVLGFLELFSLSRWLVDSWEDAEPVVKDLLSEPSAVWRWTTELGFQLLDEHWARVQSTLAGHYSDRDVHDEKLKDKQAALSELQQVSGAFTPGTLLFNGILRDHASRAMESLARAGNYRRVAEDETVKRNQAQSQLKVALQDLSEARKETATLKHSLAEAVALKRAAESELHKAVGQIGDLVTLSRKLSDREYRRQVRHIRSAVRSVTPEDGRVIVVSRGDEDLLDLHGRAVWHFPQDADGVYAGSYPADSDEAIVQLELLRKRGGQFLILPEVASWWLTHYRGFRRHLESHYQLVWDDDHCVIYELTRRGPCSDMATSDVQTSTESPEIFGREKKLALLMVVHGFGGGTGATSDDLLRGLSNDIDCYLLRTALDRWELLRSNAGDLQPIREYALQTPWTAHQTLSSDRLDAVRSICLDFNISVAHVRHLLANGPELVELIADLGIPIVFSFHDYYTVCPTIHLLDEQGKFCGGRCTAGNGDCPVAENFFGRELPTLKHHYVYEHRARMARALQRCSSFVTTSASARRIVAQAFPFLDTRPFHVIEHGRDLLWQQLANPPSRNSRVKIVCLGNMDRCKGVELIAEVLRLDEQSERRFEFHFLGNLAPDFRPQEHGAVVHGAYARDTLPDLVRQVGASFSLIASICAETYCHTLTESWSMGLPVFASNLGALQERIERQGGGWLLDPASPAAWYRKMLKVSDLPELWAQEAAKTSGMARRSVAEMAEDYRRIYRNLPKCAPRKSISPRTDDQTSPPQGASTAPIDRLSSSAVERDSAKEKSRPYTHTVSHIKQVVSRELPVEATIVVASKGDSELLSFGGRRAWHFPQTENGEYAGHYPADSDAAVRHLIALRTKGGEYFILPETGFWWLDHYSGLAEYLRRHATLIWKDEHCVVFRFSEITIAQKLAGWTDSALAKVTRRTKSKQTSGVQRSQMKQKLESPCQQAAGHTPTNVIRQSENGTPRTSPSDSPTLERLTSHLVTVIVPVYNAFDDVRRCLESLARHGRHPHRVLLIDDCSPDPRIWPMLQSFEGIYDHFVAIRNETNVGYTATINKGCQLTTGDVVLLNSDTQVTGNWLEKLTACANSSSKVGTVTPLSNSAGAFSAPINHASNAIPRRLGIEGMAQLLEQESSRTWPEVPTGNGFCLYIRRALINAIGLFDEEHFPRGYGEENDFCMRAIRAGFTNVIDDSTFIYHKGTASFLGEKNALVQQGTAALRSLHPSYKSLIDAWLSQDPLDPLRQRLSRAIESKTALRQAVEPDARECVLAIVHDGGGGTRYMVEDLARELSGAFRYLVLRASLQAWTLLAAEHSRLIPVRRYTFTAPWRLDQPMNEERIAVLSDICQAHNVTLAHVHHALAIGPEVLEELRALSIPLLFSFHDFYTVCPTIVLLDEQVKYCGGRCTASDGDCPVPTNWMSNDVPRLKHAFVNTHRNQFDRALRLCDAFVTPSETTKAVLQQSFPFLKDSSVHVIEHGRTMRRHSFGVRPRSGERAKVLCLGNLDRAKGTSLIERVLDLDASHGPHFEFHFLGARDHAFRPEQRGGVYHGSYSRDDLAEKVAAIAPSFAMIASLTPETYCYTLSESWALGLPVFASNIGTLRERISRHGGGWLLDCTDAEDWYEQMVRILRTPVAYEQQMDALQAVVLKNAEQMAADYHELYAELMADHSAVKHGSRSANGHHASVQSR